MQRKSCGCPATKVIGLDQANAQQSLEIGREYVAGDAILLHQVRQFKEVEARCGSVSGVAHAA